MLHIKILQQIDLNFKANNMLKLFGLSSFED